MTQTGPPSLAQAARGARTTSSDGRDSRRGAVSAVRAGWNDAAWHQGRRVVAPEAASWYEQGYAGGEVFREKHAEMPSRGITEPLKRLERTR